MSKLSSPFSGGAIRITQEIWKDVVGYEGLYKVSNLGRVKRDGVILKNIIDKRRKTYRVNLCRDGRIKTKFIHRLVCEAFLPNLEHKRTVNHKNFNPSDNRLENLEWATDYENINHAIDNGRINYNGNGNPMSKLTDKQVRHIKMGLLMGIKQQDMADKFEVTKSAVSLINIGKRWGHIKLNLV